MSGTGRCYDNARMESFFATLKKEKLYKIRTDRLPMAQVKGIVFRYIMTYYNRIRVNTVNPRGLSPTMYRQGREGPRRLTETFGRLHSAPFLTSPVFTLTRSIFIPRDFSS
jgi:transposase InsO family protein